MIISIYKVNYHTFLEIKITKKKKKKGVFLYKVKKKILLLHYYRQHNLSL